MRAPLYRRLLTAASTAALSLALAASTASAQAGPPPLHGHMLVLGIEWVADEPVGFRHCVDLANNQKLPLHVHHAHLHRGAAGEAQFQAGNLVVPTAPLTPWADCAALEAEFSPAAD